VAGLADRKAVRCRTVALKRGKKRARLSRAKKRGRHRGPKARTGPHQIRKRARVRSVLNKVKKRARLRRARRTKTGPHSAASGNRLMKGGGIASRASAKRDSATSRRASAVRPAKLVAPRQ